jgi:hypothetical protein
VSLYRALFGAAPFAGESIAELRESVLGGHLAAPPVTDVPPAVVAAILRALSRAPEERWPQLTDLLAAIEAPLAHNPDHDPSVSRAARMTAATMLFGVTLVLFTVARVMHLRPTPVFTLSVAIGSVGLMATIGFVLRRELFRTTHNRRVAMLFLGVAVSMVVRRLCAIASTGSVLDGLRDEAVGASALIVYGAYCTDRLLAAASLPLLAFAVASSVYPALDPLLYGGAVNAMLILAIVLWGQDERASRRAARAAATPTRSTSGGDSRTR